MKFQGRPFSGRSVIWIGVMLYTSLWFVPSGDILLVPVRPYATIIHELWHALVALMTGGQVGGVQLVSGGFGGGLALITGGWPLAIAAAGYLGSAFTGALWLRSLARPRRLRFILVAHAILLPVLAVMWSGRDPDAILVLFSLAFVAAAAAKLLGPRTLQISCTLLALQLCLAALGDLQTLLIITAARDSHNDAQIAAEITLLPAVFWAVVWAVAGLLAVFWGLSSAIGLRGIQPVFRVSALWRSRSR